MSTLSNSDELNNNIENAKYTAESLMEKMGQSLDIQFGLATKIICQSNNFNDLKNCLQKISMENEIYNYPDLKAKVVEIAKNINPPKNKNNKYASLW